MQTGLHSWIILFIVAMILSPSDKDQKNAHNGHNDPQGPEDKTAHHRGYAFRTKKWYGEVQDKEEQEPGHPAY